jgi:hypothetical protein
MGTEFRAGVERGERVEDIVGTEFRAGVERGERVEDMVVVGTTAALVFDNTADFNCVAEGDDPFDNDAVGVAVDVGVQVDEEVRLAVGVV